MLRKPKDKCLSSKPQSLVSSPKQNSLLRDNSTQVLDVDERTLNSTDQAIRLFHLKKDSIQSQYKRGWNDRDCDNISQNSYLGRAGKDHDAKDYDYQFSKNDGLGRCGSQFLKKGYCSPTSKLSNLVNKGESDPSTMRRTIQKLQFENSRLTFERNHLQGKVDMYVQKCAVAENQNFNLLEQLQNVKMSYDRLMHEYRQLSLIHEDFLGKEGKLAKRVSMLTDKNFKLQELLCQGGSLKQAQQHSPEQDEQVQIILKKTQRSIDQYVMQLDSLRQLITQKQEAQGKLQQRIIELEQICQQLRDRQLSKEHAEGFSQLSKIINTQRQLEEALQQKIQRLTNNRLPCPKCGFSGNDHLDESKQNIQTETSIKI